MGIVFSRGRRTPVTILGVTALLIRLLGRISFSCLFPAPWHFSLSSQALPRLLIPSFRQLLFLGLLLCLVGLLYLLLASGKGHVSWIREENHFHRLYRLKRLPGAS